MGRSCNAALVPAVARTILCIDDIHHLHHFLPADDPFGNQQPNEGRKVEPEFIVFCLQLRHVACRSGRRGATSAQLLPEILDFALLICKIQLLSQVAQKQGIGPNP